MKGFLDIRLVAAGLMLLAAGMGRADGNGPNLPNFNSGARYATDAYPGFDREEEMVKPERKEPRWFQFITGPNRDNASDQFAYCQDLVQAGDWKKAAKQLDALVRNWPTAPEAPRAQLQLAEIEEAQLKDYEEAFASYRYLLDFYSLTCDFLEIAGRMYRLAGVLLIEGKEIMFVRFENTIDARRAYETCVLRAPGAKWVPEAMLTIADLRVKEKEEGEAVKVYENLRNLYPDSPEAQLALTREGTVRIGMLREYGYNRARCQDTINYLELAIAKCAAEDAELLKGYLAEAQAMLAEESYLGAKFYDSRTRTKRSAINAYERYLSAYPDGEHAEEVRARLKELKGE